MAERSYHHGDLRSALLDAAEALIREGGAEGWSLREASARIGVSPSAAYHHFASRDALVSALSERALVRLAERMSRAAGRARGDKQRLIVVCRSYVRWALEDPAVARLALSAGRTEPTSVSPHPYDVVTAEVDRLAGTGALPAPARPAAEFVVWAAMHGLAILLADGLVRFDSGRAVDRVAERVIGVILAGLGQETTPSRPWPEPRSARSERLARAASKIVPRANRKQRAAANPGQARAAEPPAPLPGPQNRALCARPRARSGLRSKCS